MAARSFSSPDTAELVGLSPMRRRYDVVGHPPGQSCKPLKAVATASPIDHDAPSPELVGRPGDVTPVVKDVLA